MKLVISSDWHPDKNTLGFARFDDVAQAAHRSADYAIETKADRYLMLGDLCDPDADDLIRCQMLALSIASKLATAGVMSVWVVGNHDVLEDGRNTTVLDPLEFLGPLVTVAKEAGVHRGIMCLPYVPVSHAYDPEAALRVSSGEILDGSGALPMVVATHLMLEGIAAGSETEDMPRGRDVFFPMDVAKECFPGAILLAGHYHRRQFYRGVQVVGSLANLTRADAHNTPGFLAAEV